MDRVHPVVSILLPLYNGERYLDEAIRSVLKQSFSDWELIVQDDCSTDRGLDLVKQYKDPRIIHGANAHNLHIAGTLNAALTRANGKYIQLLAQDDRLLPDCLSTFVSMMERHSGVGFSFCAPYLIDVNGNRLMAASHAWDNQYKDTDEVCGSALALLLLFNYGCLPGCISTVMIRRECVEKVGPFDSSYRICLDWDLWIRLARAFKVGFVRGRMVEIRSHMGQESQNPHNIKERILETYRCLAILENALPVAFKRRLRWGRKKRYAAEFLHQSVRAFLAGHLGKAINLLRIVRSHDGLLVPFAFWTSGLPKRILRRVLGRGSIELRAAFDPEWFREQIVRYR
ncbi:MAG TPA: glycosyltransferase [Ktedonobacteraceae bacterium]|nr:glycosyltransferase [Ktedonobacteraceae bacterium]